MARRPLKSIALFLALLAPLAAPVPARAEAVNDELAPEQRISAEDLRSLMLENPDALVFDARSRRDYETLHIEGALLPLPLQFYNDADLYKEGIIPAAPDARSSLVFSTGKYPRDAVIVTYCNRDCHAAAKLLRMLKDLGFTNVRAMEEGVQAWKEKGYPVVEAP